MRGKKLRQSPFVRIARLGSKDIDLSSVNEFNVYTCSFRAEMIRLNIFCKIILSTKQRHNLWFSNQFFFPVKLKIITNLFKLWIIAIPKNLNTVKYCLMTLFKIDKLTLELWSTLWSVVIWATVSKAFGKCVEYTMKSEVLLLGVGLYWFQLLSNHSCHL